MGRFFSVGILVLAISACGGDGGGGGGGGACGPGTTECGGTCRDTSLDPEHCGACDVACGANERCDAGACVSACGAGLLECGGSCVDAFSNVEHCGACDAACATGEFCLLGVCSTSCGDLAECDGACRDLTNDPGNCGACGEPCAPGEVCSASACEVSCQADLTDCSGSCRDTVTDRANCGGCGVPCDPGEICVDSACEFSCPTGQIECGGACVDPGTDRQFCGASADCSGANDGEVCAAGEICDGAGSCELSCQADLIECGGVCTNPDTDRTYCGASGDCAGANDGAVCPAGQICNGAGVCALSCQADLIACGGVCTNPDTDRTYCGAVGNCSGVNDGEVCDAGEICNGAGVCALSCQAGLIACGGTCIDPDSNPTYCGASGDCVGANDGTVCTGSEACSGGSCVALDVVCQPFNLVGWACPTGATQFCAPPPIVSTDGAQAKAACEACYGDTCYEETADCAGVGYGPNPAGSYVCGDGYFGSAAGCSGAAGRIWSICGSFTTYGRWAP